MSSVALSWIAAARIGLALFPIDWSVSVPGRCGELSSRARRGRMHAYLRDERSREPSCAAVPRPLRRPAPERARRPAAAAGADAVPPRLAAAEGWRYVGVFGPELMVCVAVVRIGPARQSFWAVWDRRGAALHERTALGRGGVVARARRRRACTPATIAIELELSETGRDRERLRERRRLRLDAQAGRDRGPRHGRARRRAPRPLRRARGDRRHRRLLRAPHALALVGRRRHGRPTGARLAWNLVEGVNDPPRGSERTVWVDGEPVEAGAGRVRRRPVSASAACASAPRRRASARENLLLVRSRYRQPFGTFCGRAARTAGRARPTGSA